MEMVQVLEILPMEDKDTFLLNVYIIVPPLNKVEGGYTGFTLSVCGQNRVHSVSSTILTGSISHLHILSGNFRRFVACKVFLQNLKKTFGKLFKFVTLSSFD